MTLIAYDDGAGQVKAARVTKARVESVAFPALVVDAPAALPRDYTSRPNAALVEVDGTRYLVGAAARQQSDEAAYNVSAARYTGTDARVRLYAALARLLPAGAHSDVRVVAGLNVESERGTAYDALRQMLCGEHTWSHNGDTYTAQVSDVHVTAQPVGAFAHIAASPPRNLAKRLEAQPFSRSTTVIVDVGNHTTDVTVMVPGEGDEPEILYNKSFALDFGVQALRDAVSRHIGGDAGALELPLRSVDRALLHRTMTGPDGNETSIDDAIRTAARRLWHGVYHRALKPRLKGVQAHYIVVVGGGALDGLYGEAIRETWGALPGFGVPNAVEHAVMQGYAVIARQKWG